MTVIYYKLFCREKKSIRIIGKKVNIASTLKSRINIPLGIKELVGRLSKNNQLMDGINVLMEILTSFLWSFN